MSNPHTPANTAPQARAPYVAPRLVVHGTVAAMTQSQPSSPRATDLVEAEITFLGRNA
jgi:hypothetical protein